jgi:hypothetical protein
MTKHEQELMQQIDQRLAAFKELSPAELEAMARSINEYHDNYLGNTELRIRTCDRAMSSRRTFVGTCGCATKPELPVLALFGTQRQSRRN